MEGTISVMDKTLAGMAGKLYQKKAEGCRLQKEVAGYRLQVTDP
jgi:hypothetical protein